MDDSAVVDVLDGFEDGADEGCCIAVSQASQETDMNMLVLS